MAGPEGIAGVSQRNFLLSEREDRTLCAVLDWLRSPDPFKPGRIVVEQNGTVRDIRQYL
ncbi:MAG: hypothetical protein M1297_01590 [Nitrospirae bacterium]|nr:hypothetical protein [Nitrospirota bacterium]